jgi:hypothetical protein
LQSGCPSLISICTLIVIITEHVSIEIVLADNMPAVQDMFEMQGTSDIVSYELVAIHFGLARSQFLERAILDRFLAAGVGRISAGEDHGNNPY